MTAILHVLEFLAIDPAGQVVMLGIAGVVAAALFSPKPERRHDP